jgi:predicted TIM-barrel fold metal-dependent hydrolase
VLDRFPKLRFVFLESGCGWLPYWFERMDEHYEVLGVQLPALKSEPSKLLERGQLYFSCEPEEKELAHVVDIIGDDWIVFASDYSHFDSRFPGASEPIVSHPTLRQGTKRKILNDNARRLYRLD